MDNSTCNRCGQPFDANETPLTASTACARDVPDPDFQMRTEQWSDTHVLCSGCAKAPDAWEWLIAAALEAVRAGTPGL